MDRALAACAVIVVTMAAGPAWSADADPALAEAPPQGQTLAGSTPFGTAGEVREPQAREAAPGQSLLSESAPDAPVASAPPGTPAPAPDPGVARGAGIAPDTEVGHTVTVEMRDWENAEEIAFATRPAPRAGGPYVVKPGDTLRTIAAGRYGDRSRYLDIYAANRDQIGDPDRIYPGQTLELP